MSKFTRQLTDYYPKEELLFAEEQLKKEEAVEGEDYVWEPDGELWAIFIDPKKVEK